MGLIKEIGLAVKQELREYLVRELEAIIKTEADVKALPKSVEKPVQKAEEVKVAAEPKAEEKTQIKPLPAVEEKALVAENREKPEEPKEEPRREIARLNHEKIEKVLYNERPDYLLIPVDIFSELRQLPADEFALYVKFLALAQDQKKNYGYLGNNIRKRIGAEEMSQEKFREITDNLVAYGFMSTENITELQRTFTLYVPFNEEYMVRADAPQKSVKAEPEIKPQPKPQPAPKAETAKPEPAPKQQPAQPEKPMQKKGQKPDTDEAKPGRKPAKQAKSNLPKENRQKPEIPGKPVDGMESDDMYKSYKTFVSLEIDKAKMRVGRSNFDKIYMEAVKYIDKKYGFRVLSDQEKFQEYLTNYYISAFDIPTFEEWKKTKA